jgi:signal transduction histidine kinase
VIKRKRIFKDYHFEFRHLIVILLVLIFFQIIVSFVFKTSLHDLLLKTQEWYQRDSAEKIANLTSTSLELILATTASQHSIEETQNIIQAFNIILSQQLLHQNVEEICLLISNGSKTYAIDNGTVLYSYFFNDSLIISDLSNSHLNSLKLYDDIQEQMKRNERIYSFYEGEQTFHVFVPFVPKGEYAGAVYMKITPDFSIITNEIISSYDEITLLFTGLIFLGLLTMFYISSYTVKERNETQQLLFQEKAEHLKNRIYHEKESQFTKRIYHTHHKAEKIMGFIKEDLLNLSESNIEEVRLRVKKYANFVSRVIYDMKWYDPPVQSIRNPIFKTNVNEVIRFLIDNLFLRVSDNQDIYNISLNLDDNFPTVPINEFVVWEIIEPLIQNCIDHSGKEDMKITIRTKYFTNEKFGVIQISDNGNGIPGRFLRNNGQGIKKIFLENVTTKAQKKNSGYGCYLSYEIAKKRCKWNLDVNNLEEGGCEFTVTVPNL